MADRASAHFTTDTFRFLSELAANNDRTWFQENKDRYEQHVKEPALRFIADVEPHLERISPHFDAGPRSLFRIYRDTRFSKDRSPYKTHTGIQFRHEMAADAHAPGFYLHIQPRQVFVACGVWHPDSKTLGKIREAIVEDPRKWRRVKSAKRFRDTYRFEGSSLKTHPRGFDPEHPLIEDLRRKDFMGVSRLTQKQITDPGFLKEFAGYCRAGVPLQRFLCEAIGVPF
jgi:uncharacterized protein (TIGR02453 family)